MTDIFCRRVGDGLFPASQEGLEVIRRIPKHQFVKVKVTTPRNMQHLAKWHVLCKLVFENQSKYASVKNIEEVLKIRAGHCETMVIDGREVVRPLSVAIHSMDQSAFNVFWDAVCNVVCQDLLPGITNKALQAEVAELVGAGPLISGDQRLIGRGTNDGSTEAEKI